MKWHPAPVGSVWYVRPTSIAILHSISQRQDTGMALTSGNTVSGRLADVSVKPIVSAGYFPTRSIGENQLPLATVGYSIFVCRVSKDTISLCLYFFGSIWIIDGTFAT
jgi:hypothetical protein